MFLYDGGAGTPWQCGFYLDKKGVCKSCAIKETSVTTSCSPSLVFHAAFALQPR